MEIDPINRNMPMMAIDTHRSVHRDEERATLVAAVRAVNKSELFGSDRELMFARDRETQKPVIQILDRNTGEQLEQIPPETLLRIMASVSETGKGELNA